jgi:hypothetical protein
MGEQPQPECELCTPDIADLPIINLQDAGRLFKIKVSTISMTIARALERFNDNIRAGFLQWHIGEEDGEDGGRKRSSRPKGHQGKIHMRGM